jgi:hypothetical protein
VNNISLFTRSGSGYKQRSLAKVGASALLFQGLIFYLQNPDLDVDGAIRLWCFDGLCDVSVLLSEHKV